MYIFEHRHAQKLHAALLVGILWFSHRQGPDRFFLQNFFQPRP